MRLSIGMQLLQIGLSRLRTLACVVLFAIGSFGSSLVTAQTGGAGYQAVIDAGSSGTRLYLYEYGLGPLGPSVSVLLEDEPDTLRGLSNYADRPEEAGQAEIGPLLAGLQTFIKAREIPPQVVTVNVLATAGMRLIDPILSARIYESVKKEIANRGLTAGQVGTISGQDEGVYAWVDLNYLKGQLRPDQRTDGIVEIGGASAQVAFLVQAPGRFAEAVRRVSIGDQSFNVLSVSYLGLGQNEARRAMLQRVVKDALPFNPCYPNSQSGSVLFDAAKGRAGVDAVKVEGSKSSYSQACFDLYADVVNTTSAINRFPVKNFASVPEFANTRFVLMASFYHKLRDWQLPVHDRLDRRLLAEAFGRCAGSDAWLRVSGLQGTRFFAQNACANATYLYSLVFSSKGLGLKSSRVDVLDEVNGQPLTWTRGFALIAASTSR